MGDLSENRTQYSNESHTQVNNTAEQIVREFTLLRDGVRIDLDLNNITQNTLLKIQEKTDGTTYSELQSALFDPTYVTGDFDTDILIIETELDGGGQDMKLTMQSLTVEAASRIIPFALVITTRP